MTSPTVGPGPWRRRATTGPGLSAVLVVMLAVSVGCTTAATSTASPSQEEAPTEAPVSADPPQEGAPGDDAGAAAGDADGAFTANEIAERILPLPTARDLPGAAAGPAPVAISFPSIGVDDSPIDPVGVQPSGEMEVPSPRRVGWYEYGARPGQAGSTVLAAHIAADGVDGVFRHLADVEAGDRFDIILDDGSTVTYEVVERAQYEKSRLPFDRVFARDGPRLVTLITCGGSFQPSIRSYQDNVVVYAAPLGS